MVRSQRDFTNRGAGTNGLLGVEIAVAVIVLVVTAGIVIATVPNLSNSEFVIVRGINSLNSAPLDAVALTIDLLFSPPFAATIIALAGAGTLLVTRNLLRSAHVVALVALPWLVSDVMKLIVARPRPDSSLLTHHFITETSFSYPSGHTAFVASLGVAIVVLSRGKSFRPILIALMTVVIVVTGLSRVYLGVHYPSDIVASALYSIAAVIVVEGLFQRLLPRLEARGRTSIGTGFRSNYDPTSRDS